MILLSLSTIQLEGKMGIGRHRHLLAAASQNVMSTWPRSFSHDACKAPALSQYLSFEHKEPIESPREAQSLRAYDTGHYARQADDKKAQPPPQLIRLL
jgi:hypothetical protein